MAQEFQTLNNDDLSSNWKLADASAGSGFANNATLNIVGGSAAIVNNLDQSALSDGVTSFDVSPERTGDIGTLAQSAVFDTANSDAPTTQTSRYRNWAKAGTTWYSSNGGGSGCFYLQKANGSIMYLTAGAFKHVQMEGGTLQLSAAATAAASGTWTMWDGTFNILTHASNTLNVLNMIGGTCKIQRGAATINLIGGTLTIDSYNSSFTTINQYGGTLIYISGNATGPTYNGYAGLADFSRMSRPSTFTNPILGPGLTIKYNPLLTITSPYRQGTGPKGLSV